MHFYKFLAMLLCASTCLAQSSAFKYEDTTFPSYFPSLNLNKDSLNKFLEQFNDSKYAEWFLPFSFEHLIQFIKYGIHTKQGTLFIESSFRLFLNKIKACPYICSHAFKDCLQHLTTLFRHSEFNNALNIHYQQHLVKSVLYDSVIDHFNLLKQHNGLFFDNLTNDVTAALNRSEVKEAYTNNEQLRCVILRFLECCLAKLVWSEQQEIKTWDTLKDIAQLIGECMNIGVINKDELDDLYKSCVESYSLFLKNYGHLLSFSTLHTIKQQINNNGTMLVVLEEQEPSLQTKKARLLECVIFALGCKQAQQEGILLHSLN